MSTSVEVMGYRIFKREDLERVLPNHWRKLGNTAQAQAVIQSMDPGITAVVEHHFLHEGGRVQCIRMTALVAWNRTIQLDVPVDWFNKLEEVEG